MIQIITIHMNPKLTYVTLHCAISIFDISNHILMGKAILEFEEIHILCSILTVNRCV